MYRIIFSLLVIAFLLIGCQEGHVNDHNHQEFSINQENSITSFTLEELKNDVQFKKIATGFKIEEYLNNEGTQFNTKSLNDFDFTIDKKTIKKLKNDKGVSYTFLIHRKDKKPREFENLIIEKDSVSNLKGYIIKYQTDNVWHEGSHEEITGKAYVSPVADNIEDLLNKIENPVNAKTTGWTFVQVTVTYGCSCKNHMYPNCDCEAEGPPGSTNSYTETFTFYVANMSDIGGDPAGGSSGETGGGGGFGGNDNPNVGSTVIGPDGELLSTNADVVIEVLDIFNFDQIHWLRDPANSEQVEQIRFFLQANDNTQESLDFALEAINALMDNQFVNFEDAYIETETPDDGYLFQGEKQIIPSQLSLDNGNIVSVTFGVTRSDGENANKQVSKDLVDGLKFALNEANNNLSSSEKITSIYVSATTNGKHSPTSNHSNGTAIDISRINGEKMILSGVTNQIIQLQLAFDNYVYIRENFGPHFKHKTLTNGNRNNNHPVGGHKDHIHISVRRP